MTSLAIFLVLAPIVVVTLVLNPSFTRKMASKLF